MRRVLVLYLAILGLDSVCAQSGFNTGGGANFLGYARAGVTIEGVESIYFNQAGLADIQNLAVDASYERRFNIEGLDFLSLAIVQKTRWGTFGLSATNFGLREYNEQKFGLAYARRLSPKLSIGGQLDYLRFNIETLGSRHLISFEAGMILQINRNFKLGTHIFSPGVIEVAESTDLPTRFRIGLSYHPSNKVFILIEADKSLQRQTEYKMAVGYEILKQMRLKLGMNPTLSMFSMGFQVNLDNKFKISGAMGLNNSLGHTPAISLQYAQ